MARFAKTLILALGLRVLGCALSAYAQVDSWQELLDAGNAALRKHQYITARKDFRQALDEAIKAGFADPRVAKAYKLVGDVYFAQKEYDKAKVYYARSSALQSASGNLASAEHGLSLGDFQYAKGAIEMAIWNAQTVVGRNDIVLAPLLVVLAKSEKGLLTHTGAEENLVRAIRILDRAGVENADLGAALCVLGALYDEQGKHSEAEPLLERALAIQQTMLPPDDPKLGESLTALAEHYRRTGRAAEAEPLDEQAQAIRERILLHFKEYVDKENGFRFEVPEAWTHQTLTGSGIPDAIAGFSGGDGVSAVLVQRMPIAAGLDPILVFERTSVMAEVNLKGETVGEENVTLSGLPARRVICRIPLKGATQRDWATFLVTRRHVWVFHVLGPEKEMSSFESVEYRVAQKIADSFSFTEPTLSSLKTQVLTPPAVSKMIVVDASNRRYFSDRDVGMKVLLPEGWKEMSQGISTIQQGKLVVLSQTGTLAVLVLAHEYLEASPPLYLKLLKGSLEKTTENYIEISRAKVTRQLLEGTRLVVITTEAGIDFRSVIEVFSTGKEHYRIVARAPTESYKNYRQTLDQMMESVEFLPPESQLPRATLSPNSSSVDPD